MIIIIQAQAWPKKGDIFNYLLIFPFLPPGWPKNELKEPPKPPENPQILLKCIENDKD